MIRSVFVALEGMPSAEVALRYAVRVARWHDARVVMLALAQPEEAVAPQQDAADMGFSEGEEFEDEEPTPEWPLRVADHPLVDAAASLCGQHRVAWRAEGCAGDPRRQLARYAARADIVTVSRRGAPGARRELPQHAFAVLRTSARSVLVTPETYQEPQVILVPYDRSAPAARALSLAAETSRRSGLPISVASVGGRAVTTACLAEAKRYLAHYPGEAEFVSRRGDPVDQVTALSFELGSTMLVMGAYGRSAVRRFFAVSRTERILGGCHGPALAVR